ncbi:HET-domain-containing protein [Trametes coccinea BRFM310]|uniref:HET-domain-containing protein n=1 Tax=Trametes coccinea (strain BRFM310) TaxID=1353009 RepID=A0A1Y2IV17_TRAC3|nr:HET-domain-containing protein [Trametes coccinea BRFM310]
MWLLDTKTGALTNSKGSYAILSHVWSPSGEQTFQEVRALIPIPGLSGASAKIKDCCAFARGHGYSRVWIDTCCIDKTSSAELSEAINSMYLWYSEAVVCIVFLEDVDASQDPRNPHSQFRRSRWWRRGWTLQELIAPRAVLFVSRDWEPLGTKRSLADIIEQITGIDRSVLANDRPLNTISVARRMSWAAGRETTRLEDEAYSLMGLFDIHMPTLYGEGRRAFIRLQEEILRRIPDQIRIVVCHTRRRLAMPRSFGRAFGPLATAPR